MQARLFSWLGRECVEVVAEASSALAADGAVIELFQKCDNELRGWGLSLDNIVRVRVWGRDRERVPLLRRRARRFSRESARRRAPASFPSNGSILTGALV